MKRKILSLLLVVVMSITYLGLTSEATSAKQSDIKPGTVIYVNADATGKEDGTSWSNAFTELRDALDAAVSGNEIWVGAGTYKPTDTSERNASFVLKSGVKIYGGFAGWEKHLRQRSLDPSITILSGDIGEIDNDTDNSYHVVYANGVIGAVLDGFTVTRGRGVDDSAGAGMYNESSALTVENCIFSHNKVAVGAGVINPVTGHGGGMYNKNSAPVVTNCTFIGNQAGDISLEGHVKAGSGGGMYNEGYFGGGIDSQGPVITGCIFIDNVATQLTSVNTIPLTGGGAMYNKDCSPAIDRCTFSGNSARIYGGAVFNYGVNTTITNSIFNENFTTHNEGAGGAVATFGSSTKMINSVFYRNGWRELPEGCRPSTIKGGAVYQYRSGLMIANTVFMENANQLRGGAIYNDPDLPRYHPTLFNNLFYRNIRQTRTGTIGGVPVWSEPEIIHIIETLSSDSAGNQYDIDPRLADPDSGNFRLSSDSPCIDLGTPRELIRIWLLPIPSTDFDGNKRIVDGDGDGVSAVDIGAYEYVPSLSGKSDKDEKPDKDEKLK